jgi:hypothetical protein
MTLFSKTLSFVLIETIPLSLKVQAALLASVSLRNAAFSHGAPTPPENAAHDKGARGAGRFQRER